MYNDDPFFNLTMIGRGGLGILSAVLFMLLLGAAFWSFRKIKLGQWAPVILVRLALALVLFWAFEWLSPQIYYQYFQLIFDGLPMQIVVKSPPSAAALYDLLTFSAKQTISYHSRAILGWALIAAALITSVPNRNAAV